MGINDDSKTIQEKIWLSQSWVIQKQVDNIKLIKLDAYGTMLVMEHKQIVKSKFAREV